MRAKYVFVIAFFSSIIFIAVFNATSAVTKKNGISVMVAGDAIISVPWSDVSEPLFTNLIDEIRTVDVAVLNLETLIHSYKGFPQAESGGSWMASEPKIASELAWAGIDMVGLANNHTFDYGAIGVIENIENLRKAGIVYAGAGMDLQEARHPAYFDTENGKVALLSTASTFVSFGKAGRSRPGLHGRPGLNPLTVTHIVPSRIKAIGLVSKLLLSRWAYYAGVDYYNVNQEDRDANLEAVRQAKESSELVIMSVHAHQKAPGTIYSVPKFLQDFAHQCIENGVDIFFAHGPHIPKGIEIYQGKPIFYSLGNFVLQAEMMDKQPARFYAKAGLGDEATMEDVYGIDPPYEEFQWESFVAKILFDEKLLKQVELIPISLGMHKPKGIRGRPSIATAEQGEKIIEKLAEISRPFGTRIAFDGNYGLVEIE